ncbi:uridine kinase [Fulvivirgaceae bacterium PWU4]|uniref:Uridine kinase n=1 Tax=Chryseosolibacter histidini TaxID=2782349 RepID=A0AAP2DP33_9BACT|nr:P-loop NTPase fold protein [Chryseosolibacter histidini]MBT1698989.1 uridine kinase [Chryseosolibacter histidini]
MQKPFTIGITGGSGSGKTFFINSLSSRFAPDEICLISQDHYYKAINLQTIDSNGIENFDLPSAIEREKFHEDILKIKKGETVTIKEYTFNNPKAEPTYLVFKPAPILIIEGLFVQYFEEIASELDLKIFIEAKDYIKLSRRIRRDNDERGYDIHDVLYRFQHHVMPVYETLIKPLKQQTDLIIPNNQDFSKALDILTMALKTKLKASV